MTSGVPYAEVIGDPVAHSKSPALQRFFLDAMNWPGEYRAMPVKAGELAAYFAARSSDENWRGCNITMPHKFAALEFASHRNDPSFPVEPISLALRKEDGSIEGLALDATSIVASLTSSSLQFGGQSGPAVVLGAGGAAQAACWALAHFGCAPIWLLNRSAEKAAQVAAVHTGIHVQVLPWGNPLPPAAIVINATPQGLRGYPEVDLDLSTLPPSAIVYDMIYEPLETSLLRRARERGLATFDGLDMLIPQVAMSCERLFGPPGLLGHKHIPRELWGEAKRAVSQ